MGSRASGEETSGVTSDDPDGRRHGASARIADRIAVTIASALALALGFLALERPWVSDDFYNAVVLREHPGLWDYVSYWYSTWSGRFSASVFSWAAQQIRPGYAIATWIGLLLLVVMTFAVARARLPRVARSDLYVLALLAIAFWYGLPSIQETVFWASGLTAYLMPAVTALVLVYRYRRWEAGAMPVAAAGLRDAPRACGMFLLGLWVGGSQEQVLVACVLLLVILGLRVVRSRRPAQIPASLHAGAIGLVLAGAVSLTAPGNGVRLDAVPDLGLGGTAVAALKFLVHTGVEWLPPLMPWLICLALLAVPYSRSSGERSEHAGRPSDWWIWVLLGLASISPFLIRPYFGAERTLMFLAVLLAVAAVSLGSDERVERVIDRIPATVASGVIALLLVLATGDVALSGWQARNLTAGQRARAEEIARQKDAGLLDVTVEPIRADAPRRGVIWGDGSTDRDFYVNQLMASYYGVDSVIVASEPVPEPGVDP